MVTVFHPVWHLWTAVKHVTSVVTPTCHSLYFSVWLAVFLLCLLFKLFQYTTNSPGTPRTLYIIRPIDRQDSCAIAKMTARCALYMGALKISGTSWLRPRLLFPKFFMGFRSDRLCECAYVQNLKSVVLLVPEMVTGHFRQDTSAPDLGKIEALRTYVATVLCKCTNKIIIKI